MSAYVTQGSEQKVLGQTASASGAASGSRRSHTTTDEYEGHIIHQTRKKKQKYISMRKMTLIMARFLRVK